MTILGFFEYEGLLLPSFSEFAVAVGVTEGDIRPFSTLAGDPVTELGTYWGVLFVVLFAFADRETVPPLEGKLVCMPVSKSCPRRLTWFGILIAALAEVFTNAELETTGLRDDRETLVVLITSLPWAPVMLVAGMDVGATILGSSVPPSFLLLALFMLEVEVVPVPSFSFL